MIPYGRQEITEEDIESVINILKSDYLTQGSAVPLFEKKICEHSGSKFAVAVNSCTSALHIACLALDLKAGDLVWTSPISFVASANCALYCGAEVDFVDINPDTALMSILSLKNKLKEAKKINKLPKIVIPVHFAGQSCDMKEIYNLGKEYGFRIIEDAAHAIGGRYLDKHVGSCQYSDIAVYSFHPVKIITSGEGGAALTNSSELSERMRLLRSHGITRDPKKMKNNLYLDWYYEQISLGFNYRMTDIQASLGISQLKRLDQYVDRRNEIAKWYDKKFSKTMVKPLKQNINVKSSYHLYIVRVNNRDKLFSYLRENHIGANVHYIPIYKQPYFSQFEKLEGAEEYYNHAITLPIYPSIAQKDLDFIARNVIENSNT